MFAPEREVPGNDRNMLDDSKHTRSRHEIRAQQEPGNVRGRKSSALGTPNHYSSTLENGVFKKHRFQVAPRWRAFSNGSIFGDRFRRCSVDDSRIRSKTAPFSFENGLVWTEP